MQLNERIQKILDEQELDQPALAKIAGVTKATVNQWLLGKIKSIKLEYAIRIQERYGYSAAWIVLDRGPERHETWPFKRVKREAFDELPPEMKDDVEKHLEYLIHKNESATPRKRSAAA